MTSDGMFQSAIRILLPTGDVHYYQLQYEQQGTIVGRARDIRKLNILRESYTGNSSGR